MKIGTKIKFKGKHRSYPYRVPKTGTRGSVLDEYTTPKEEKQSLVAFTSGETVYVKDKDLVVGRGK